MIILPMLGLPSFWKNFFVVILGIWICFLFIFERRRKYSGNLNRSARSQKIDSIEIKSGNSEDVIMSGDFTKSNDKIPQV